MTLNEFQAKLLQTARRVPSDDRVPYAFEKSVMARIAALPKADFASLWAAGLWRAAASALALMVLVSALVLSERSNNETSLASDLENTLFGSVANVDEIW